MYGDKSCDGLTKSYRRIRHSQATWNPSGLVCIPGLETITQHRWAGMEPSKEYTHFQRWKAIHFEILEPSQRVSLAE